MIWAVLSGAAAAVSAAAAVLSVRAALDMRAQRRPDRVP
jgi:hypothetical protein